MFGGIAGSLREAQREALQASATAFRFVFQSFYSVQPVCIIIICIDEIEVFGGYKADCFIFPYLILLLRIDVGIAVEYSRTNAVGQHTFDDGRRTRCAAAMQQHLVVTVRSLNFQHCESLITKIILSVLSFLLPVSPSAVQ